MWESGSNSNTTRLPWKTIAPSYRTWSICGTDIRSKATKLTLTEMSQKVPGLSWYNYFKSITSGTDAPLPISSTSFRLKYDLLLPEIVPTYTQNYEIKHLSDLQSTNLWVLGCQSCCVRTLKSTVCPRRHTDTLTKSWLTIWLLISLCCRSEVELLLCSKACV